MQVLTEFEKVLLKLRDLRACVLEQVPRERRNMYFNSVLDEAGKLVEEHLKVKVQNRMLTNGNTEVRWSCTSHDCTADLAITELCQKLSAVAGGSVPLYLTCPGCGTRHIDEGEFATKTHHTHACQECGLTWRPAVQATVGVRFLPGFKNET